MINFKLFCLVCLFVSFLWLYFVCLFVCLFSSYESFCYRMKEKMLMMIATLTVFLLHKRRRSMDRFVLVVLLTYLVVLLCKCNVPECIKMEPTYSCIMCNIVVNLAVESI